jgi:ribonuclease HI
MTKTKTLKLHSDGGARGNPGPAGAGAVLYDASGTVVAEISRYLGQTTNNQAEYQALILGLEKAVELGAETVACYLDSELIVKQLNGQYKVKHEAMKPLFQQVQTLRLQVPASFHHVRREYNKHADALVNQAIDRGPS